MLQAFRILGPALAAVLLLAGCGGDPRPPARLLAGWDASRSFRPRLAAAANLGGRLVRRLRGQGDRVTLFRMDAGTTVFYDGAPPSSLEQVQGLLVRELEDRPRRDGTFPARFWQAAADHAAQSREPVVVLLLTDGGNDDLSPEGREVLRAAVRRLAANERLRRLCVWGVIPSTREDLRADLAPLGDRAEIRGFDDVDQETLLAALR